MLQKSPFIEQNFNLLYNNNNCFEIQSKIAKRETNLYT